MEGISQSTTITRAANAAFRELDGKMFIVGANSTKLRVLNQTGAAVWRYLEQPATLRELAHRLADDYDVELQQAVQDCAEFLATMVSRDLVVLRK